MEYRVGYKDIAKDGESSVYKGRGDVRPARLNLVWGYLLNIIQGPDKLTITSNRQKSAGDDGWKTIALSGFKKKRKQEAR